MNDAMDAFEHSPHHKAVLEGLDQWGELTNKGGCWVEGGFANCYFRI